MTAHTDERDDFATAARAENFPVATRLLPREVRRELLAVYAFARLTDDVGDEYEGDRLAALDELDQELDRAAAGTAHHPVFRQLSPVLGRLDVGKEPFRALIEANRMDQRVHRYATIEDLRAYCMLSAAPIGRIVLSVFNLSTPDRVRLSDEVCIGLQLTEHLQDVGEDARRGRVYLPEADLALMACAPEDLLAATASTPLRRVISLESGRARDLLAHGTPLAATLPLRPRIAVVGFAAGGLAALDAVRRAEGDVLGHACRPTKPGFARRALRELLAATFHGASR